MNMEEKLFLCPRLCGQRFEKHGIPLDILNDFATLNEIVKCVAKTQFLLENADRERVPRGFMDDVSLQITGVQDGSALVQIALVCLGMQDSQLPPIGQIYAEKSRDCILKTMCAVERGEDISDSKFMTPVQLSMFNKFGCSLNDDECVEFKMAGDQRISFNKALRTKILNVSSAADQQRRSASVYGVVHEANQEKHSFILSLTNGQKLSVQRYSDEQEDDVLTVFQGYMRHQKVRIRGVGLYDRNNKLASIMDLEQITLLPEVDFGFRIDEIKNLKPGWYNGTGSPFDRDALEKLVSLFMLNYAGDKDPYVYPTPDNALQLEWDYDGFSVSLEVNLVSFEGSLFILNTETDEDEECQVDLSSSKGWSCLNEKLARIGGKENEL